MAALRAAWRAIEEYPHGHVTLLTALEEYLEHPEIIVIRGDDDIERWRDDLISGARSVNDYSAAYPRADRSQLRTLTQRARTANDAAMRKKHARALFRWLRDNQETA